VLNFGTVPWRIVSIKLSNNYTFDLGCVRNPDIIYPYVIPNTPDRVVAPYIPQGAAILPPRSGGQTLIGLVPPVTAPITPVIGIVNVTTGTITNPPTTITTGTNGGGVGGSTSTVNIIGGTAPPPPAVVRPLNDFVRIDKVVLGSSGAGLAKLDFTFNQPDNPMYAGVQVYYKLANPTITIWNEMAVNNVPGPNQPVTFSLPNLVSTTNSVYSIRIRVKYSTGQFSIRINSLEQVTYSQFLGIEVDPTDYVSEVTPAWESQVKGIFPPNTRIAGVYGIPTLTDGGTSVSPRETFISVAQDSRDVLNPNISGVAVYFKPSNETYWTKQELYFPSTYVPSPSNVNLGSIEALGNPGDYQFYDFIFRFIFKDGQESTNQYRYIGARVETAANGTRSFNIFDPSSGSGGGLIFNESSTKVAILTVDMAPVGTVTVARNTKIGLSGVFDRGTSPSTGALFHLVPPADANAALGWLGVNVYYRRVQFGLNPAFTKITLKGLSNGTLFGSPTKTFILPLEYNQSYQIVIVPLVLSSGAEIESGYSWAGRGYIHNNTSLTDYPETGNWISSFNFIQSDTSLLLGKIQTGFDSPVAIATSWKLYCSNPTGQIVNNVIPYYYELIFDVGHITSFNEAYIWRRTKEGYVFANAPGFSPYFNLGRWEKITLTTAFSGYNATTKKFTVKLKFPISHKEFYGGEDANTSTKLLSTFPPSPIKEINPPIDRARVEYYIQIKSDNQVSPQVNYLVGWESDNSPVIDILSLHNGTNQYIYPFSHLDGTPPPETG
jgi:hypothetical protein